MPAVAQLNRPLREPSGYPPSASNAMSTRRDAEQRGRQPHTCGTVSSRAGAAPWLRGEQPNVWRAGQVFHPGRGAAAVVPTAGCCGSGGGAVACGSGLTPLPAARLGGGGATLEMNQVRFCASQVYVREPQLPYEHVLPAGAHVAPCGGASFGQPSFRAASHRQSGGPGGLGTPLHGVLRTQEHLPSGYTHPGGPALTRSSQAPLAVANDAGQRASAADTRATQTTSSPNPRLAIGAAGMKCNGT